VGGDLASGPMPQETLDHLLALPALSAVPPRQLRSPLVRLFEGVSLHEESSSPKDIWEHPQDWVAQEISERGWDLFASLPETVVLTIDRLGPTLFCHGSPLSDEGVVTRLTPDARLSEMLAETAENVIVCGHTHVQFDRVHNGKRVINAGSVGMHQEGFPGAYWLLIGPKVELRRTSYDIEAAAARIRATGIRTPAAC
jgi:diadenosine tetraphosphatase ApaH/serine/threonine PP2A family protein phosphatase